MTGAFIFAIASFPLYSQNVDPGAVGVTFVVGSLIFTTPAYSSFVQVINDGDDDSGAVAASTLTTTDEAVNATIVNSGTFAGAICFFAGAYLLLPPAKTPNHRSSKAKIR